SEPDGDADHPLVADRRGFDPHAFGRDIEHPRQHHDDGEAEQQDEDEDPQRPGRGIEGGETDAGGLHGQPRAHEIDGADLDDLASLQLGEQRTCHAEPPGVAWSPGGTLQHVADQGGGTSRLRVFGHTSPRSASHCHDSSASRSTYSRADPMRNVYPHASMSANTRAAPTPGIASPSSDCNTHTASSSATESVASVCTTARFSGGSTIRCAASCNRECTGVSPRANTVAPTRPASGSPQ